MGKIIVLNDEFVLAAMNGFEECLNILKSIPAELVVIDRRAKEKRGTPPNITFEGKERQNRKMIPIGWFYDCQFLTVNGL